MFFVERLEGMLANGRKLPLTSSVVVDQAAALEIIDELRHAIPEEVQSARRINAEGERILERANQEAERIIARGQDQAAYLIEEQGLAEAARAESQRILDDAEADAGATRRGADEYAGDVLLRPGGTRSPACWARSSAASMPWGSVPSRRLRPPSRPGVGGAGVGRRMTGDPANALVINVAGLLGEPPGAHRDLAVEGVTLDLGDGLAQASPIRWVPGSRGRTAA